MIDSVNQLTLHGAVAIIELPDVVVSRKRLPLLNGWIACGEGYLKRESIGCAKGVSKSESSRTNYWDTLLELTAYPNPSMGSLTIEVQDEEGILYLYSVSGTLLLTQTIQSQGPIQLNLSSYASGTYFLKFEGSDQWQQKRLILIK